MGLLSSIKNFFCNIFGIETKEEKEAKKKSEQGQPEIGQGEQYASDKEKEEKEREWKDLSEEVKFVCQGGKIQCKYCNPPIAEMLPTSTLVMLQDKPYMTVNDKDGIVNFNFTGLCMHPSQQKPLCPPPPCKAVIKLGAWKDYSETMIDNYNALLAKSKIPCMISGEDLEIIHSGQMAELSDVKPKVKREPRIIESYWINTDGERIEKIAPNKKASLVIATKDYRKKDEITIKLPIDREEKTYTTHINSKGIATLENIFMYEDNALKKEPHIVEAYWRNEKGEKISEVQIDERAILFIRTEGYEKDEEITVFLNKKNNEKFNSGKDTIQLTGKINSMGIAEIKNKKWA